MLYTKIPLHHEALSACLPAALQRKAADRRSAQDVRQPAFPAQQSSSHKPSEATASQPDRVTAQASLPPKPYPSRSAPPASIAMDESSGFPASQQSGASRRQAPHPAKKAPWPTPFTGAIIALLFVISLSFRGAKKEESSPQNDRKRKNVGLPIKPAWGFHPSPWNSHSRHHRLLLAIPHAPPACFRHWRRQASVPFFASLRF